MPIASVAAAICRSQPLSTHLRDILHHAIVLLLLQPRLELIQAPLQLWGLALRLAGLGKGDAAATAQLQAGEQAR